MIRHILVLTLLLSIVHSAQRYADQDMMKKHHNEKYPKNGPSLTVHLIPHSHDDVGWLKTVDNYYYGGDMRTQFAGVQYTIDTVVSQLADNPSYKFTIVEMAFLYRWWNQASEKQRETMRRIVANKQLHFMNAGWCMSDEANMYYEDFIDQMTVGLRWLKDTLNYVPDVAWHIDPFGHHSAAASLFSQLGFNSFFFARIDYQDKEVRLNNKSMQMIWRPYQYNGDRSTYIFTHVNYYHYSSPPGFCFDDVCRDEPIKDDPTLEDYNIEAKSKQFVDYFKSQALHYRTTNLMHTLGQDFQYTNAHMFYKNIDKIVRYINSRPQFGATILYSTPTDYIAAIQKEKAAYPVKTDDFFPYADGEHAFWTGYFTSRVALKGFVKDMSRYTQAVRKHISQLKISNSSDTVRNNAKQIEQTILGIEMALGILQHHDAVAGTAKQKVTDDYVATGLKSVAAFNKLYNDIKKEQIKKETGESVSEDLYFNLFWNQTGAATGLSQKLIDGKNILVNFYNPGSKGTYLIKLRVPPTELNIIDQTNKPIVGDTVCANLKDSNDCEVIFYLDFDQSSNAYIKLSAVASGGSAKKVQVKELTVAEQIKEFTLGSDKVRFTRGNQSFDLTLNGVAQTFKIFYNYYEGWDSGGQHSGAYIFRPKSNSPKPYSNIAKMHYADGATHGIIILQGDRSTTRVYFSKTAGEVRNNGILVQTQLDPIPVADNAGKEVTLNIKTNYKNANTFYTDSMGLEQQKRVLDFRPTWNYTVWQPTAGNYYPINAFISLKDQKANKQFTILSDRSQGGAVIREGEFEIMIHRRLLVDDGRGVGQPLNETDADKQGLRQTFRHYIVFGNNYRNVQKRNDQRILPAFSVVSTNTFSTVNIRKAPITVPASVKLYLRPFEDGTYLVRFHNTNPSQKASVTLGDEWKGIEYTLAANQLKSDWKAKQLSWNEQKQANPSLMNRIADYFQDLSIIKPEKSTNLRIDGATTIDLNIFELRAFKLSRA